MKRYKIKGCGQEAIITAYSAKQAINRFLTSVVGTRTAEVYLETHQCLAIEIETSK